MTNPTPRLRVTKSKPQTTAIYFSALTGAFYDTAAWPHDLPGDVVVVTPKRHQALMAAMAQGKRIRGNAKGAPQACEPSSPSPASLVEQARRRRDREISQVRWLIDRHRDEQALQLTTTLTSEDYALVLKHVQDLRDITEQAGFPASIAWPVLPPELLTTSA